MVEQVIKRDGRIVNFNRVKIEQAIYKAMDKTDNGIDKLMAYKIAETITLLPKQQMSVEEIQDEVEKLLLNSVRKDVAKEYISYRNTRNIARQAKTRKGFLEIVNAEPNDVTRENANMNADTPAGMMMKFASETTKSFVADCLLSPEASKAHSDGYIHIHDADYFPTKSLTCCQHPLDRILSEGFSAGHAECRPAKHIETASILGCISLESAQNK